jgi:hypothetical protein
MSFLIIALSYSSLNVHFPWWVWVLAAFEPLWQLLEVGCKLRICR